MKRGRNQIAGDGIRSGESINKDWKTSGEFEVNLPKQGSFVLKWPGLDLLHVNFLSMVLDDKPRPKVTMVLVAFVAHAFDEKDM